MIQYEFNKKNVYRISKPIMKSLFDLFKVKNIEELRKKIDAGFEPNLKPEDYTEEKKRLVNLNLTLDIWDKLKNAGYDIVNAEEIIVGKQKLSIPNKPLKILIEKSNGTKSTDEKPQFNIDYIINSTWNKFLKELRELKDEWKATCNNCDQSFYKKTRNEAIDRFKLHLKQNHEEDLIK